jgi:hypothetical protein
LRMYRLVNFPVLVFVVSVVALAGCGKRDIAT